MLRNFDGLPEIKLFAIRLGFRYRGPQFGGINSHLHSVYGPYDSVKELQEKLIDTLPEKDYGKEEILVFEGYVLKNYE